MPIGAATRAHAADWRPGLIVMLHGVRATYLGRTGTGRYVFASPPAQGSGWRPAVVFIEQVRIIEATGGALRRRRSAIGRPHGQLRQ